MGGIFWPVHCSNSTGANGSREPMVLIIPDFSGLGGFKELFSFFGSDSLIMGMILLGNLN
jgi:hypothetical protein